MKLKLLDRVVIGSLLPKEDSFDQLIIADSIKEKTKISKDEIKKYEMKTAQNGGVAWPEGHDKEVFEFEFDELEQALVTKQLEALNSQKKLNKDLLGLYRAFVTKTEAKAIPVEDKETKPTK